MQFIDDIESVRRRVATQTWASGLIEASRATAAEWMVRFQDSPARVSGWGHDYFCTHCSSRLIFDLDRPYEHVCSSCGKVNDEQKHHDVWVATYRGRLASALLGAALVFRLEGDERLRAFIARTLLFYAERYEAFEVHGGWVAKGKIMWQSLDEAIFAINLMKTVEIVKDELGSDVLARLHRGLFRPLALFVARQPEHLLNIRLWIRSAVTIAGLQFDDPELVSLGLDGTAGIRAILAQAVTDDRLWIEGSLHYHFYALNALTETCHFMALHDRRDEQLEETALGMYRVPLALAYRDLSFPNPNDGWPDIGVPSYLAQYELAQKLFPDPDAGAVLSRILGEPAKRSLSTLLFVPDAVLGRTDPPQMPAGDAAAAAPVLPLAERSVHLPAMNFVKLCRGSYSIFFRYGYQTRAHAHFDRMGIEIYGFSPDPSNVGYGSVLHGQWYMSTVAHNTVVVDGENQAAFHPGECLSSSDAHVRARAAETYPGVTFERELTLEDEGVRDRFACTSAQRHVYDWLFHCRGTLTVAGTWAPEEIGYAEHGYQHLSQVRRLLDSSPSSMELRWRRADGASLTLAIDATDVPGAELYSFLSLDNPPTAKRSGVLVRARGPVAEFRSRFTLEPG